MEKTRTHVHEWGQRTRVVFEVVKEIFVIIYPRLGEGDPFKILDCLFDVNFIMKLAVDKILCAVRPKIQVMLRVSHLYTQKGMIQRFEIHIWEYIQYAHGCILHASDILWSKFENLQQRFFTIFQYIGRNSFLEFGFVPIFLRRDIGILGFIHKRDLQQCLIKFLGLLSIR